jgi:hypothetical protein
MREFYLSLIILIVLSCKKNNYQPEDNGCSNLVIENLKANLLPQQETDTIMYLFTKNQMSLTGLQFYGYSFSRGYNNVLFRYVNAYQFINGLRIFTDFSNFAFGVNDSLTYKVGDTVTNLDLPDKPKLLKSQVRWIFINEIKKNDYQYSLEVQANCVEMEFGYYDLNAGSGNQIKSYTTAWKVYPKDNNYPYAYIDDRTGNLIYFDNGIIIIKNKQSKDYLVASTQRI